jgi:hypothetical protein
LTMQTDTGKVGGEGKHDMAENYKEMGSEGRNAGAVDGEDSREGID